MSEPHAGSARAADALSGHERDARVEQLLLQGLDHYFAGAYDQAIHIWTRVLFLDRGHTRARAYIERARSALAERHRESEEILHRGVDAFDRGDAGDARSLLDTAVQLGASPEVALSYLGRLDRLTPASGRPGQPEGTATEEVLAASPGRPAAAHPPRRTGLMAACLIAVAAASTWLGMAMFEVTDFREALRLQRAPPTRTVAEVETPLPVPRPAELALDRARELFATGHPLDALRALGDVGIADPLRADADRLRADIQRSLLSPAASPIPPSRELRP